MVFLLLKLPLLALLLLQPAPAFASSASAGGSSPKLVTVRPPGSPVSRQFLLYSGGDCNGDCPAVVLLHGFSESPYLISKTVGFEGLIGVRGVRLPT